MTFHDELRQLINRHSQENISNTPDFILAQFMLSSLIAFDTAVLAREKWYGQATKRKLMLDPVHMKSYSDNPALYVDKFFYEILKDENGNIVGMVEPVPGTIRFALNDAGRHVGFVQVIDGEVRQYFSDEQILVTDRKL
jgi:hypothetical protein